MNVYFVNKVYYFVYKVYFVVQRQQYDDLLKSSNPNKHVLALEVNVDIAKTQQELLDVEMTLFFFFSFFSSPTHETRPLHWQTLTDDCAIHRFPVGRRFPSVPRDDGRRLVRPSSLAARRELPTLSRSTRGTRTPRRAC